MASDPEVLVVGGGVGGLVTARRLALEGRRVTVLEQSSLLGGQVARQRVGRVNLDAAAETFATRDGTVARLLTELGLGADVVQPRSDPAWLHRADGTAVPLPATGLLGIPGSRSSISPMPRPKWMRGASSPRSAENARRECGATRRW